MPRAFNGSSDNIVLGAGDAAGAVYGTLAQIVRHTADGTWASYQQLETSSAEMRIWVERGDDNKLHYATRSGGDSDSTTPTMTATVADGWVLIVGTKGSGSATPRLHKYVYSTGVWTHENAGSSVPDGGSGVVANRIGEFKFAGNFTGDWFQGDIALTAVWKDLALTDSQVEQLAGSVNTWIALGPTHLSVFDQDAVAQLVIDLVGSGHQTSISGTSVSTASSPIGYGYETGLSGSAPAGGGGTTLTWSGGGTLSLAGNLRKLNDHWEAGTLGLAGALTKQTARRLTGTLASAGTLTKRPQRFLAGVLGAAGALAATKVKVVALAGTLTSAGTRRSVANLLRGGTLPTAGALLKRTARRIAGTLTSGALLTPSIPGSLPLRDDFTGAREPWWDATDTEAGLSIEDDRQRFEAATTADVWGDPGLVSTGFGEAEFGALAALVRLTNRMETGKGFRVALSPDDADSGAADSVSLTVQYPDLFVTGQDEPASDRRQRSKDLLLSLIKRQGGGHVMAISEGTAGGEWPVFPEAQIVGVTDSAAGATLYAHLASRRGRAFADYVTVLEEADRPAAFATRFGPALASEASGTRASPGGGAAVASIVNCGTPPRIIEAVLTRTGGGRGVLCFRGSDSSYANCWRFKLEETIVGLYEGGTLATQTGAYGGGADDVPTHVRVVDFGDRIDCYKDGQRVLTWDSTSGAANTWAGTASDTGTSDATQVSEFAAWGTVTLTDDFGPFPEVPEASAAPSFSDAFTGTNGTPLATHDPAWSVPLGSFEINGNRARIPTAGANGIAVVDMGTPDHIATATIGLPADAWTYPDDVFQGVVVRFTDVNNFIQARLFWQDGPSPEVEIWEYVGGAGDLIAYVNVTGTVVSAGDYVLALAARDDQVAAFLNGECVAQGTTTVLSGDECGLIVFDNQSEGQGTWENFSAARTSGMAPLTGTLALAGTLRKLGALTRTGTLATAGVLRRTVNKVLSGVLATAGALLKRPARTVAGMASFSGTLSATKVKLVTRSGTLTASGALTSVPHRNVNLGGTLFSAGAVDSEILGATIPDAPEFVAVSKTAAPEAGAIAKTGPPEFGLRG